MKLLILGATGGTGRHLFELAVKAGHQVTALVRDPDKAGLTGGTLVKGQATQLADLEKVLPGHDAVLSAIGPREKADPVCADTAKALVAAMKKLGIKRVSWVSAGGVGDSAPQLATASFVFAKIIVPLMLKKPYANHALAEQALQSSGLEWTILRPVQLVDGAATGKAVAVPIGSAKVSQLKVSRRDVAAFMLEELKTGAHVGKAPIIEG